MNEKEKIVREKCDSLNLSQLQEQLAIHRAVTAFLMAFLAEDGLINLNNARSHILAVAEISGFHEKALSDVEQLFNMAELTVQAIERAQLAAELSEEDDDD